MIGSLLNGARGPMDILVLLISDGINGGIFRMENLDRKAFYLRFSIRMEWRTKDIYAYLNFRLRYIHLRRGSVVQHQGPLE